MKICMVKLHTKISKDHKKYWKPEDTVARIDLPEIKVISKKKDNFLAWKRNRRSGKKFFHWPRSHGGFFINAILKS